MNKITQIVLVAFIVSFPNNNSNAFISAATKGGQLLSKLGIFKKAAPAAKVGLIDEVARESIKLKNINKSLIDEIDLNEKEKIFSSIKNSDEIAFQDYKNYDQEYSGVKLVKLGGSFMQEELISHLSHRFMRVKQIALYITFPYYQKK